jgi:hypothetical protein
MHDISHRVYVLGRTSRDEAAVMIRYPPLRMPAPPAPEMALPRMKVIEFRATAQIKDPASKIAKALMNTP